MKTVKSVVQVSESTEEHAQEIVSDKETKERVESSSSEPTVVEKEDVQEQRIRMVASAAAVTAEDTAPANILAETQKKEHLVERINGARSASESNKKETPTKSDLNDVRTEEAAMVVKENMLTLTNSMRVEKVKQDYYDTKVIEETPGTVEQVTDNIEETSQDMIIKEEQTNPGTIEETTNLGDFEEETEISTNSAEVKDDPEIEETAESVEIDTEISANIAETVISESSAETVNKKEESAQEPSVSNPDEFRRISQNPIPAESTNLEVMKEGEKIDNEETAPLESENTDIIKKIKETEVLGTKGGKSEGHTKKKRIQRR